MTENDAIEMEDPGHEPPMPELKLALAVVCAALFDCRRGIRKKYKYEKQTLRNYHEIKADEARDFLLHRLNEPGNIFGEILRYYGMRPLTEERLALLARLRPTRSKRHGMRAQIDKANMLRMELLAS